MDLFTATPTQLESLITRLTPRQVEILHLIVQGKNNSEIATILSISRETVKFHIQKACRKAEVDNRIQLIVMFTLWRINDEKEKGISK